MRWDIYLAAAFGAFVSTLVDLMWNPTSAMTIKLREVLVQHIYSGLDAGWPLLVLLVILGMGAAFVNTPTLRVDGFARGLAVFALLSLPPSPSEIAAPKLVTGSGKSGYDFSDFVAAAFFSASFDAIRNASVV